MRLPDKRATIAEKVTPLITGTLQDAAGTPIPFASVVTLTVRIMRMSTNAIVNSRTGVGDLGQNILGTVATPVNGGSLAATSGAFSFQTVVADTTLLTPTTEDSGDQHQLLFRWTYGTSGLQVGDFLLELDVRNTEALG